VDDLPKVLAQSRSSGADTVVFFALPGREASDRMEQNALRDAAVAAALREGGFHSARADGFKRQKLYEEWIGNGEGMGIAVVGHDADLLGARPGPQDAPELAAFLRLCAGKRAELAARRAAQKPVPTPANEHALGTLLLQLGCRKQAEPLLVDAALAGRSQAAMELALLYGQDGRLVEARRWLKLAPAGPAAQVVDGYVAFKERRHQDAVRALETALQKDLPDGERQRACLFLAKALHECGRSQQALEILRKLAAEGSGSTFEGAALHTIAHIESPDHGHTH
jgi:tetratricopeptide (TPR) repeat protein